MAREIMTPSVEFARRDETIEKRPRRIGEVASAAIDGTVPKKTRTALGKQAAAVAKRKRTGGVRHPRRRKS